LDARVEGGVLGLECPKVESAGAERGDLVKDVEDDLRHGVKAEMVGLTRTMRSRLLDDRFGRNDMMAGR
jgi:hypothetical protein